MLDVGLGKECFSGGRKSVSYYIYFIYLFVCLFVCLFDLFLFLNLFFSISFSSFLEGVRIFLGNLVDVGGQGSGQGSTQ